MSDQSWLAQFGEWAEKLSDDELKRAIEFMNEEYRMRYQRAAILAALNFKPGDWIENLKGSRKLPAGARGHIVAIKLDRVEVHFPDYEGLWAMTPTLIRKVDGPPAGKDCKPH